jgi:hypothetical protein
MKDGGIASCSLNLIPGWKGVFSFTPRPIYSGERDPCTFFFGTGLDEERERNVSCWAYE